MKIQPLGDRVLVEPIKEDEVKKGGIIIPDTAKEKPQQGKVIAVGSAIGEVHAVSPAWSADGKYVYCVSSTGLWRIPAAGGTARRLITNVRAVSCWWPSEK